MEEKLPWMCHTEECTNPKEGRTDFCSSCNTASRKAAKFAITATQKRMVQRANQVEKSRQKRPRIAQVSEKRQLQLIVYAKLEKAWLPGKVCAVCGKPAGQVHHMAGRENELLLLVKWWLPLCPEPSECHERITRDSAWAIEKGYSIPRNQIIGE